MLKKNFKSSEIDKSMIPKGDYCYEIIYLDDEKVTIKPCPYYDIDENRLYEESGYCHFLKEGDWECFGFLYARIKECNENV